MSNGLNVTDVLSLHNDQVRLAQELMTKTNHLLETSKKFFNKTPIPPPPSTSLSTIVEQQSTPSPPSALPNFNMTNEFRITAGSPQITVKKAERRSNEINNVRATAIGLEFDCNNDAVAINSIKCLTKMWII
ncbi:unnamed protein product [Rotaria socialis]|nr:unnamed protein product [Rotaria socialis]